MMNFPIDIVYTWVDGGDPAHHALFGQFSGKNKEYCRFADNNELYYSLYSVYKFAPWVRRVFIVVADYQQPNLQGLPAEIVNKVTIIKHSQILPERVLPVFNSEAIESCLHKIPDLAEHFIYFNDDMFLGAEVTPADFFSPEGHCYCLVTQVPTLKSRFYLPSKDWLVKFLQTIALSQRLAYAEGKVPDLFFLDKILHQCYPCRKSLLEYLSKNVVTRDAITETAGSRLRLSTDIHIIFLMYIAGQFLQSSQLKRWSSQRFIMLTDNAAAARWRLFSIKWNKPKLFCINNDLSNKNNRIESALEQMLIRYYK